MALSLMDPVDREVTKWSWEYKKNYTYYNSMVAELQQTKSKVEQYEMYESSKLHQWQVRKYFY